MRAEVVGMSFSWEQGEAAYVPMGHSYPGAPRQLELSRALGILKPVLEQKSIVKVGQNIKADALVLRRHRISSEGGDLF